jgi:hypothetical protein
MRRKLLMMMSALSLYMMPALALAQDEPVDARLQGYANPVVIPGSTALYWLLVLVLAGACVGVMFMNAKRSHLD